MLTDEQIYEGGRKLNPKFDERDLAAMRRFMKLFQCEDAESFEEAKEKCLISMDLIQRELSLTNDIEETKRNLTSSLW